MGWTDTLRRVMDGDYDGATAEEKLHAVRDLIQVGAVASAAIAVQPVPLLDMALLAPIQIGMVQGIGRVHGYKLDKKAVLEILSTFGASIVAQSAIMAAAKLVPFLGWAAAMSMAYALTYAIGEVADHYFRSGRGVSSDELKEMFQRVYKEKKTEKDQASKGNSTLKDKLEQLTEARKSGLLTEEEFEKKKHELLSSF
jgi:uncharacterized protein (DUF697 family)